MKKGPPEGGPFFPLVWNPGNEVTEKGVVPGAEARTAELAKIGGDASPAEGDLTMETAPGSAFQELTKA
jgi:hypothetical protein